MSEKQVQSFVLIDEVENATVLTTNGTRSTQTIDLNMLFPEQITSSGSFDLQEMQQTTLGRLLNSLPVPAMLVDISLNIIFANRSCEKLSPHYKEVEGTPFTSLFPHSKAAAQADGIVRDAFLRRKPQVAEGVVKIEGGKIWGRIHLRAVRIRSERGVLVLIEDLTADKEKLALKGRLERELRKSRDQLEQRVR
ncbi:PAS domain S-box protein, partial [Thermodesulfobacteriota bacterium]